MSQKVEIAQLVAFGDKMRAGVQPLPPGVLKEFGDEVVAAIELASPKQLPANDVTIALVLLTCANNLLFRAAYSTSVDGNDANVAMEYIKGLVHGKIEQDIFEAILLVAKQQLGGLGGLGGLG